MQVAIFRKDSEVKYAPKASASVLAPVLAMLSAVSRFPRPELVAHFLPTVRGRSAFARQIPVTRSALHHLADCRRNGVLTDAARETLSRAWIVPADEIGREPKNGERNWISSAQAIGIYCKDRVGRIALEEGDLTILDPEGGDLSVILID